MQQENPITDTAADDRDEIDRLDLYRLDYEEAARGDHHEEDGATSGPIAAGGEPLREGDHVYMFCGVANVSLYQHHGIVLDVQRKQKKATAPNADDKNNDDKNDNDSYILIAEFTNAELPGTPWFQSASHASTAATDGVRGGFRFVRETDPTKWHKVRYQASAFECWTWNPGTCSAATPDSVDIILTRIQFLREQYYMLPKYNILTSNCESVAVWCMTGQYMSLQGNRALDVTKLAVPAAGALVFPALGVALGGLAIWHSVWSSSSSSSSVEQSNDNNDNASHRLNREFCWYAMGRSPAPRQWEQWEVIDPNGEVRAESSS
jgi:hypothetical protein